MRPDVGVAYELYLKHAEKDGLRAFVELLNEYSQGQGLMAGDDCGIG